MLILVLVMFLISFAAASITFSPGLAVRALAWGAADVYDHLKFPNRTLKAADTPFSFERAEELSRVRQFFEMDPHVNDFEEFLESTKTQAFIVVQDDQIIYEEYFNGAKQDSIVTSFSVAKSFTSALVGIAIEEGAIGGINDPITDYIPELLEHDARFADITIRDLLLMSSGIRYVEALPYGDDARTYLHPDLRSQALTQTEILEPPGKEFHYNNYHPLLLGMVLERATEDTVTSYLQSKLWEPLGMEFDGSWSLDSERSGFEKMESGINARAIDFAKFGRLYLHGGNWNGSQIIPRAWVNQSVQEESPRRGDSYYSDDFGQELTTVSEGGYYKYMWYGLHREGAPDDFFAAGNKGQFIYVSPSKDLIIERHGEEFGIDFMDWIELFYEFASRI